MSDDSILNLADNKVYSFDEVLTILEEYQHAHSRQTAVLMHQLMWSWVYQETNRGERIYVKDDFFNFIRVKFGLNVVLRKPYNTCFLCDYVLRKSDASVFGLICSTCPAIWSGSDGTCCHDGGEYCKVESLQHDHHNPDLRNPRPILKEYYLEAVRDIAIIPIKIEEDI